MLHVERKLKHFTTQKSSIVNKKRLTCLWIGPIKSNDFSGWGPFIHYQCQDERTPRTFFSSSYFWWNKTEKTKKLSAARWPSSILLWYHKSERRRWHSWKTVSTYSYERCLWWGSPLVCGCGGMGWETSVQYFLPLGSCISRMPIEMERRLDRGRPK